MPQQLLLLLMMAATASAAAILHSHKSQLCSKQYFYLFNPGYIHITMATTKTSDKKQGENYYVVYHYQRHYSKFELRIHSWLQDTFGAKPIEKPVTKLTEERKLYINRRAVEHFLRFVYPKMKEQIFLDKEGGIDFRLKEFLVTVEVPKHDYAHMHIHTAVLVLDADANHDAVIQRAMELNFTQKWSREASLGIKGDEIRFFFHMPVDGLRIRELKRIMRRFFQTVVHLRKQLEEASRSINA
jgi:hypothetical protein